MPVVLEPADWPAWLGEADGDPGALLRPAADGVLRAWPISTRVNAPRNNAPDLLDELKPPHVD
jgi:putative SOS response-associated peptidase YedK